MTHVDTSSFALKTNLAILKTEFDKLDIDKLVPIPVDLSKLSDLVKNDVFKKTVYDKLVAKVSNIDTNAFVLKTKYNVDKTELEKKIPNLTDFIKKTKLTELENKIPDISSLAIKAALTAVENRIPSVSDLFKKADYNTKITDIENLVTKADFGAKLSSSNRKITQNKTKHLLVERELNNSKTFDSSYFNDKSYFEEDGPPNYLAFETINKHFKLIANTDYVSSWKSKGLSSESNKPPATSDNSLTPALNYYGTKTRVKFTGSCLKQSKISYTHRKIVNIFIVYELGASSSHINDPTLKNCLFDAVNLTENADIDKYGYSGYGIEIDRRSS